MKLIDSAKIVPKIKDNQPLLSPLGALEERERGGGGGGGERFEVCEVFKGLSWNGFLGGLRGNLGFGEDLIF